MLYHLVQKYDLKGQLALNDNHGVKELKIA
jgi:hypothetical protein